MIEFFSKIYSRFLYISIIFLGFINGVKVNADYGEDMGGFAYVDDGKLVPIVPLSTKDKVVNLITDHLYTLLAIILFVPLLTYIFLKVKKKYSLKIQGPEKFKSENKKQVFKKM